MPISRKDALRLLLPDEPAYAAAAQELGDGSADLLAELAREKNVEIAAKAASLAGFLGHDAARTVLDQARVHSDASVRTAAATAIQRHPQLVIDYGPDLLIDPDVSVRKWTMYSIKIARPHGARLMLEDALPKESVPALRQISSDISKNLAR